MLLALLVAAPDAWALQRGQGGTPPRPQGRKGRQSEKTEPKELPPNEGLPDKGTWATCGAKGRPRNIRRSLFLNPEELEDNCHQLFEKYDRWAEDEIRYETYNLDEGEPRLLIAAYGMMARICMTAIDELAEDGIHIGLFRPISVYPFPSNEIKEAAQKIGKVLCVEMSMGQMIEDVQAAVGHDIPVSFFGRTGGVVPSPDEVIAAIKKQLEN